MKWSGVFLGLLVLAGLFDGIPACRNFSMAVPAGDSRNISIPVPHSISTPPFFMQKYNTITSSWEDVISSYDEGSEKFLSSFKETLSFSGGLFKIENASKGAEGRYRIQDHMYKNCLAVVNVTVQVPVPEPSTAASYTSDSEKEHRNETKGEDKGRFQTTAVGSTERGAESRSWIFPVVFLLSGAVRFVPFLLCKRGKSRGKVCVYPQQLLSKMTNFSQSAGRDQQSESSQDSQESEELTRLAHDKDRDQALGTRERNGDPAPENGEGDLLTGDRDQTQEPGEMDPLAEDTGLAQGTKDDGGDPLAGDTGPAQGIGGGLPTLEDCPGISRN